MQILDPPSPLLKIITHFHTHYPLPFAYLLNGCPPSLMLADAIWCTQWNIKMGQSTNILGKMQCTATVSRWFTAGNTIWPPRRLIYFSQHFFWLRGYAINMPVAMQCVGSDCRKYAAWHLPLLRQPLYETDLLAGKVVVVLFWSCPLQDLS